MLKTKKVCSFIVGAIAVLSISTSTVVKADGPAGTNTLGVSGVVQEQTYWCWAASTKCVSDYLGGNGLSQSEIVKKVKGSVINEGATPSDQTEALSYDGVDTSYVNGTISQAKVKSEIDNDRPILSHVEWSAGGAHAEVIYGYSGDLIYFMDPWPDDNRWNLVYYSNYVNNSKFHWVRTYYHNELS